MFEEGQFFIILLTVLWIYSNTMYFDTKQQMFMYLQFMVSLPLIIILSADSFLNGTTYGYLVAFAMLLFSCISLVVSFYKGDKKKK